jgi:Matrixin/CARDB
MKTGTVATLLISALLVTWHPTTTAAFSTDGATWGGASTTLSLNSTSFPAGNVFNNNAQFAMSDWNGVAGSAFRFFVNSTNCDPNVHLPTSDNCVAFVAASSLNGALGVTTTASLFGSMLNADVRFNVGTSWTSGLNVADFSFGPPFSFRGVARHEFGHVLGLCHEDRTGNVVLMNSLYTAGGVKPANPHWDDRNGVRSLYSGSGSERDLIAYMWKKTTNDVTGCASSATFSVPVASVPTLANAGDTVTLEYSFENAGNLASGNFNIAFLLSTNNIISIADTLVGTNLGASAPAHSRGTFTRALVVPGNTPPGTFFLGICLDQNNGVSESNEGNNCAVAPGSVTIVEFPVPQPPSTLVVRKFGSGSGTVVSNPAGINCGSNCSQSYANGTVVTLTPTALTGSAFTAWIGNDPDCLDGVVTMDTDKTCRALFEDISL